MKHLIKTDDYSSLEYVKYDRVVFDSTDNKVYCNHYVNPIDIVLYDKNAARLIVVKNGSWTAEKYPSEGYTPVGVVVVPASHNVYGDGSCGVMSLVDMNTDTPDTGSTVRDNIYWGYNNIDIDTLMLEGVMHLVMKQVRLLEKIVLCVFHLTNLKVGTIHVLMI